MMDTTLATKLGLHTRVGRPGVYHREYCVLCGQVGEKQSIAMILSDGSDVLGRLCQACIVAGHSEAARRALQQADALRIEAQAQAALAQRVGMMDPAHWCPVDALKAAHDEADRVVLEAMRAAGEPDELIQAWAKKQ